MKKISLFIILALSMVVFSCEKEEIPPPKPELKITTVEGRLINHITQQPIVGEKVFLAEFLGVDYDTYNTQYDLIEDTTDVNGEFKFNHTESEHVSSDFYGENLILLVHNSYYDNEKTIINGELSESLPSSSWGQWIGGLYLKKGEHHSLLIEFSPKE